MRVVLERTFLTTASGTRVIDARPEYVTVEANSLPAAIIAFVEQDHGRVLGTISEVTNQRAVATAWKNRLYILSAEPARE
ncbi:MAG TPA: hypothetical protein VF980_12565 [Thermoanaerobaculia bacterium]